MSNTQPLAETPPSTEVMTKVIAKYKDWESAYYDEHISGFWNVPLDSGLTGMGFKDPRTDLAEAMRLLWWIMDKFTGAGEYISVGYEGWLIDFHRWSGEIPTTGPAFCTAACNLAAKCLGLSEGGA